MSTTSVHERERVSVEWFQSPDAVKNPAKEVRQRKRRQDGKRVQMQNASNKPISRSKKSVNLKISQRDLSKVKHKDTREWERKM